MRAVTLAKTDAPRGYSSEIESRLQAPVKAAETFASTKAAVASVL